MDCSHFSSWHPVRCATAWLGAVLAATLLVPANVHADIYQWTDEQGGIVISNVLPDSPKKPANLERLIKEPAVAAANRAATQTEQMLRDRIDNLERRLQARTYPPAPPPGSAPAYYGDSAYYPPPPPPPPPPPSYYSSYPYPVLTPAYSYGVYPRTFVTRPALIGVQRNTFRGGAVHHGSHKTGAVSHRSR
jgi:hypothetical protein